MNLHVEWMNKINLTENLLIYFPNFLYVQSQSKQVIISFALLTEFNYLIII